MKVRESLKPGPNADEKRTVGANMNIVYSTVSELPPDVRERATRVVASRAHDTTDARLLLDVLGLLPAPTAAEATP